MNPFWPSLSNLWGGDKDLERTQAAINSAETDKAQSSNPFLTGLTDKEIRHLKREAWSVYGTFWSGVASRSRYVRQPLLETLEASGAPSELQMVPVVESSYDPYVVSSVGATGLWQLMPETAKDMHVKSDANFDGRRDIRSSTKAAAKYLTLQHQRFGNWPMAFAAYHLGPNAVQRRLDRRPWQPKDGLKAMPLPPITKTYIRHIIGLIALHEQGKITFPEPFATQTMTLHIPVDIAQLQKASELPKNQIFRLNPKLKLNQYFKGKSKSIQLRISQVRVKKLQQHIPSKPVDYMTIKVAKGESIGRIGKRFRTSPLKIMSANPGVNMRPKAGTKLRIPVKLLQHVDPQDNPMVKPYLAPIVDLALN
ncbi:MAG: transglycosylase SLT domain-containing protein [Mariprofundus sp.]|nr:transglycosylase SLT domain-containing protein [Mariprofundus sp.]